jgi:molecular chaperone DnaJ
MDEGMNYYEVLGVLKNATQEQIIENYEKITKSCLDADKLKQASEAYEVLIHPNKKNQYDCFINYGILHMLPEMYL